MSAALGPVVSAVLTLLLYAQEEAPAPKGRLVVVGGGRMPDEVWRRLVEAPGGKAGRAAVLPYASQRDGAGDSDAKRLRELGVPEVSVPRADDPAAVLEAIRAADLIWMPGGDQTRLMRVLSGVEGAVEAIRDRHRAGATVGGTSAGAAVMSKVMISGGSGDEVKIGEGLGLWPEAIVDQHFLKRSRQERLKAALRKHPGRLGVGIDEGTAVFVGPGSFEVVGASKAVVMDARRGPEPRIEELSAGSTFELRKK